MRFVKSWHCWAHVWGWLWAGSVIYSGVSFFLSCLLSWQLGRCFIVRVLVLCHTKWQQLLPAKLHRSEGALLPITPSPPLPFVFLSPTPCPLLTPSSRYNPLPQSLTPSRKIHIEIGVPPTMSSAT